MLDMGAIIVVETNVFWTVCNDVYFQNILITQYDPKDEWGVDPLLSQCGQVILGLLAMHSTPSGQINELLREINLFDTIKCNYYMPETGII